MGDQPGAGGSRSYKIRGYTRERQSAKPYSRPPGRKKGVIETVKDFFSPSWLVDFFRGNQNSQAPEIEDAYDEDGNNEVSQTIGESSSLHSNVRSSSEPSQVSTTSKVGNGQLRSSFGPGYFSSILRERELSSDISSTSRPSRTFGLSSGIDRVGEPSTSSARSEEFENEVPSSRREDVSVQLDTVEEEDVTIVHVDKQESNNPEAIMTSTPALFSTVASKRRANTSIFGEPLPTQEASSLRTLSKSRPQLFLPSTEPRPRPQPYSFPKNQPSFSVSAFGSPVPPKPPQAGGFSSPFYRGKTSFGGASSLHSSGYKRLRTRSPTLGEAPQPVRKVITPKPVSSAGSSDVTSQTAKRILEALESMSSPLIDARKIPTPPITPSASPLSFSPATRKRPPIPSRAIGSPRTLKAHISGPPVQDLSAPQQAPISHIRPKETVSPERGANSSSSLFSTATTTVPTFTKPSVSSFTPTPLPISLSPSSSDAKAGGKVKSARSRSHYTQRERVEDRSDEVVNPIPEVTSALPLPLLSGKSLPSFSFTSTPPTGITNSTNTGMPFSTGSTVSVDLTKNNFKFAEPTEKVPVISKESPASSESGSNKITFSFSQPVSKSNTNNDNKTSVTKQDNGFVVEVKQPEKPVEPNNNLFKRFAPLPGSWTCDTCLVSNKATDTKCVACQSSKPSTEKPALKKPPPASNGSWSCDTCMITNEAGPSSKPPVNADSDLLKKSALPSGSWSSDTCLVQNKSTDTACVACQSPNSGVVSSTKTTAAPSFGISSKEVPDNSLATKFAPPAGSWTCDTCMLSNKGEDSSCVACETPKPGVKPAAKMTFGGPTFSSGQSSASLPFTFGVNNSSRSDFSSPASIKFGVGNTQSTGQSISTATFTFGSSAVDKDNTSEISDSKQEKSSDKLPTTFKFGASAPQPSVTEAGENKIDPSLPFTFGTPAVNHIGKDEGAKAPDVTFGVKSLSDKEKAGTNTGGFSFGSSQVSTNADKPNSIAAAAATGFKVPEVMEPVKSTTEQSAFQTGAGMSIADAAKSGFLKVPTVGETKDDSNPPPNMNLFAPAQTTTDASTTKPQTGSGFSITVTSTTPSLFGFGAGATSSSATLDGFVQGLSGAASSPFQFGAAVSSSTTASSLQVTSTTTPAACPFSLPVNTATPAKTTAGTPFSLIANPTAPATTSAPSFTSFVASAVTTASTTPAETFQFAPSGGGTKPPAQSGSAPLFQFGAPNTTSVTSSASQPAKQTFGITSAAVTKASDAITPFGFNVGSTNQGFSFAVSKPAETSTGTPSSAFAFGASAPKPDSTFPAFGGTQPSSNQQTAATPFVFGAPSNSTPYSEETMEADSNNSSSNLFGSAANSTGSAFGSAAPNSGFNFRAPSAPSTGGFNFGGVQANTGSGTFAFAPTVGGTPAFGASVPAANPPGPGGFNFSTAAANSSIGSSGVFNFGGGSTPLQGNSMFVAGTGGDPSNPAIAQRKMKKAVRRKR